MQDENVACREGKVTLEYALGCFGTLKTLAHASFSSIQYYNLGRLTVQLILNIPLLSLAMYSRIQV